MAFYNRQHVVLVWNSGEEAICPECGHFNAMLHVGHHGDHNQFECRDCHLIVICGPESREGKLSKAVERDGYVVARSLGRSCSKCHGFDLVALSKEAIHAYEREYHGKGWNIFAAPNTVCSDCGEAARY